VPSFAICGIGLDPYLALNGVTPESPTYVGGDRLALLGGLRRDLCARKRSWGMRTVPLLAGVAEGLRQLAEGEVDAWSFDEHLFSAAGRPPASGTGFVSTNGGRYGNCVAPGLAGLAYNVGAGSQWTLMGWRRAGGSESWLHFLRLSTGEIYKNNILQEFDPGPFTISGSRLVIQAGYDATGLGPWEPYTIYEPGDRVIANGRVFTTPDETSGTNAVEPDWNAASNPDDEVEEDPDGLEGGPWVWENLPLVVDDVVFMPFRLPDEWRDQVYAEHVARAWVAPQLRLTGDLVGSSAVTVRGHFQSGRGTPHYRSTGFEKTGEILELTLMEE